MATPVELLDQIDAASKALRAQLAQPPPVEPPQAQTTTVSTSDELVAALAKGGAIDIAAGSQLVGAFVLLSGTTLIGNGALLKGPKGAPTLDIPPGVNDIKIADVTLESDDDQRVILIGRNDAHQTTLDVAPRRIAFTNVTIPTFRGKRGIECNGGDVTFANCIVTDVFDPAGRDSQAIGISANSPGNIHIDGGQFSAGSEPFLMGGSTPFTPGNVPANILIENAKFFRPLAWQTDGVKRVVKNLVELKTGRKVIIRNCVLDGCWKDGQDGYAFVITPHAGGDIQDVLIADNTIDHVGGFVQILGQEYAVTSPVTPSPVSGLILRGNTCTARKAYGLAIAGGITGAPADVTFDGNTLILEGTRIVGYDAGNVLTPDGTTTQPAGPMGTLTFTGNRVSGGMTYSFMLQGVANAGPTQTGVKTLTITGNTFSDASSALKKNAPQNTYVTGAEFAQLVKQ